MTSKDLQQYKQSFYRKVKIIRKDGMIITGTLLTVINSERLLIDGPEFKLPGKSPFSGNQTRTEVLHSKIKSWGPV